MIKQVVLLFLGIMFLVGCRQQNTSRPDQSILIKTLSSAFETKNNWLINANYDSLSHIFHKSAIYGHSNCWFQDFGDIIDSTNPDSLIYERINISSTDLNVYDNIGIIKGEGQFVGVIRNTAFDLKLCFVETWIYDKGKWQILARQSAKIK